LPQVPGLLLRAAALFSSARINCRKNIMEGVREPAEGNTEVQSCAYGELEVVAPNRMAGVVKSTFRGIKRG